MVNFALVCEELYASVDTIVDYSKKLRRQTALGLQQQTTNQLCFMYRETNIREGVCKNLKSKDFRQPDRS